VFQKADTPFIIDITSANEHRFSGLTRHVVNERVMNVNVWSKLFGTISSCNEYNGRLAHGCSGRQWHEWRF